MKTNKIHSLTLEEQAAEDRYFENLIQQPEIRHGYNAAGDFIKIQKVFDDTTYERDILDNSNNITDREVVGWVCYSKWIKTEVK